MCTTIRSCSSDVRNCRDMQKKYAHKQHMGILCSSEDARNCGDMQITCATSCRARQTSETVVYMQKISRAQTTISSFCARRTSETVVQCKFFMEQPFPHFVLVGRLKLRWHADFSWISCSSDVRNCGVHAKNFTRTNNNSVILCSSDVRNCGDMQIFHGAVTCRFSSFRVRRTSETAVTCKFFMEHLTLSSFRVRRTSETVVQCVFFSCKSNRFVVSCWSDVRHANFERACIHHFVLIGRSKLWWHSSFSLGE